MKLSNLLAMEKGSLIHEKILTCNQTFSFPRKLYLNEERITQDRSPQRLGLIPFQDPLITCTAQENKTSLSLAIFHERTFRKRGTAISSRVMKISPYDDVKRRIKLKDSLLA